MNNVKPDRVRITKMRKKLASGREVIYSYRINPDGSRTSLGKIFTDELTQGDTTVFQQSNFRTEETIRIARILMAGQSVLVVGEQGIGKTYLADRVDEELRKQGYRTAYTDKTNALAAVTELAEDVEFEIYNQDGKKMTLGQIRANLPPYLRSEQAMVICDNVHRWAKEQRIWLEELLEQNIPMLILATSPPPRDIFTRLPRIELKRLKEPEIREIMTEKAKELKIKISSVQIASMSARCGGNPMLAKRVVQEEFLGLEELAPDHTRWIDGTPFLIAGIILLTAVKILGLAFDSTSLYLLGGITGIILSLTRLISMSLPKGKRKLGE